MNNIYLEWKNVHDHVQTIIEQMNHLNWQPQIIVGITRGGLIPAVMISHYFDIQMDSINLSLRDNVIHNDTSFQKIINWVDSGYQILIVDDINDSGATITTIMTAIKHTPNIKFATLVNNQCSDIIVDFFGMNINKQLDPCWIIFPWEKEP